MKERGLHEVYLRRFARVVELLGLLSTDEVVLVDSTPIFGAGQQLDAYNLLAGAIRKGLAALAQTTGQALEAVAAQLELTAYLSRTVKGQFDVDWESEASRIGFLDQLVRDARKLKQALDNPPTQRATDPDQQDDEPEPDDNGATLSVTETAAEQIEKIIEQDVEFSDDGAVVGIRHNPGGDRQISVSDPEMRHGRKSRSVLFAGYKVQLVVSLLYGWILLTRLIKANEHDGRALPALMRELAKDDRYPSACVGDHAYGTIANHHFMGRQWLNDEGEPRTELIARMARPANGGRFPKDDFHYDAKRKTLRCPAGDEIPMTRYATRQGQKGMLFEFPRCSDCPLRKQCVASKREDKGRTVFIVPEREALIRQHLLRREQPDFVDRLAQRSLVEHGVQRFVRAGGRHARRFGEENVAFDAGLSAVTANLTRLAQLLEADSSDERIEAARDTLASLDEDTEAGASLFFFVLLWRHSRVRGAAAGLIQAITSTWLVRVSPRWAPHRTAFRQPS
jgi:transposase